LAKGKVGEHRDERDAYQEQEGVHGLHDLGALVKPFQVPANADDEADLDEARAEGKRESVPEVFAGLVMAAGAP
jgi:hypothetical protein